MIKYKRHTTGKNIKNDAELNNICLYLSPAHFIVFCRVMQGRRKKQGIQHIINKCCIPCYIIIIGCSALFLTPVSKKFPFSSFYICKRFFQKEKSLVNAVSASGVRAARQEDTVSYWEASVKSIFHRGSEKVPSIYFLHQIPFSS